MLAQAGEGGGHVVFDRIEGEAGAFCDGPVAEVFFPAEGKDHSSLGAQAGEVFLVDLLRLGTDEVVVCGFCGNGDFVFRDFFDLPGNGDGFAQLPDDFIAESLKKISGKTIVDLDVAAAFPDIEKQVHSEFFHHEPVFEITHAGFMQTGGVAVHQLIISPDVVFLTTVQQLCI